MPKVSGPVRGNSRFVEIIVEGILDGTQSPDLELKDLFKPISFEWDAQRKALGRATRR
jgi:hypothetical protein